MSKENLNVVGRYEKNPKTLFEVSATIYGVNKTYRDINTYFDHDNQVILNPEDRTKENVKSVSENISLKIHIEGKDAKDDYIVPLQNIANLPNEFPLSGVPARVTLVDTKNAKGEQQDYITAVHCEASNVLLAKLLGDSGVSVMNPFK